MPEKPARWTVESHSPRGWLGLAGLSVVAIVVLVIVPYYRHHRTIGLVFCAIVLLVCVVQGLRARAAERASARGDSA